LGSGLLPLRLANKDVLEDCSHGEDALLLVGVDETVKDDDGATLHNSSNKLAASVNAFVIMVVVFMELPEVRSAYVPVLKMRTVDLPVLDIPVVNKQRSVRLFSFWHVVLAGGGAPSSVVTAMCRL
jgi:hypothetical protein